MGVEKMIISKLFCSSSRALLIVRKRPRVVNGGGFVVTTNNDQKVVFTVDGCGTIGLKGELIVRDGDGEPILFIRKRGGIVEALSIQKQWKGFRVDYEGAGKLVFTLRESVSSCIPMNDSIKVCMELNKQNRSSDWDYEVRGSFIDRDCTINDRKGHVVAQVEDIKINRDIYRVAVQPGYDQAFVIGVIAVLDYINGESTICC